MVLHRSILFFFFFGGATRQLTLHEMKEILHHQQVWFVSLPASKVVHQAGGYDDDKARYRASRHDHIAYRYEVLDRLGSGAFSDVYRVYDHATDQQVALKIIRNERRFHVQGQVEVKVLEVLRREDPGKIYACVRMFDWFTFREHLCITFELHHDNLYDTLKANLFAGLDAAHVINIAADMLRCLGTLRKNNIIHGDLKPENVLTSPAGTQGVTVIDFGSSCFVHHEVHTYIQSRYYRAPEVLLGLGYDCAIDMWSVGCILVELTTGSPIFPAKHERELMALQTELLGIPPTELLDRAARVAEFFQSTDDGSYTPRRIHDRKGNHRPPGTLRMDTACGSNDAAFVDFVRRCLTWDPGKRMTPSEGLAPPYITGGAGDAPRSPSATPPDVGLGGCVPADA